ncbi:MAG: CDP-alcohol phosphatidyltransferase family protein [Lachnospiraceae bacterium]|nr:CDP-alcohol phosphatidyltransferase family protein [Lachnospiraceae bacterium]
MIGFYDYTVILTFLSVVSSVVGMGFAVTGHFLAAIICLLVSGLCDLFDGMVARTKKNRTEEEKKNGIQLDSLADIVCFGAFPALIGLELAKEERYFFLMVIAVALYVLCGIIRLAYFNVTEDLRQQQTKDKRKNYEGLPITSVALIIPALFCSKPFLAEVFPIAYMILLILVAVCFILKWKIKKLGITGNIVLVCIGILILAILVATGFLH